MLLARWLAADWFQGKVEAHRERLRRLDEKLGHNGLLVVMAVRLVPVVPYSVCNYLLGVTRVSLIDVALGTVLGSPPHVIVSVTAGANPHLLKDWRWRSERRRYWCRRRSSFAIASPSGFRNTESSEEGLNH